MVARKHCNVLPVRVSAKQHITYTLVNIVPGTKAFLACSTSLLIKVHIGCCRRMCSSCCSGRLLNHVT